MTFRMLDLYDDNRARYGTSTMDHSNLFHEALTKVHDIVRNGTRNNQSWNQIADVVDRALQDARNLDAECQRKWPRSNVNECPSCKRMFNTP